MKFIRGALILVLLYAVSISSTSTYARPTSSTTASSTVLISALAYYGYDGNKDEAVQLTNISPNPIALDANWTLRDAGNHIWSFPSLSLPAGSRVWVANTAASFTQQFGFAPALSYSGTLEFANHGGSVSLLRTSPELLDTANASGGSWDAGTGSPTYRSMERIDSGAADTPANWADANIIAPIALDGGGGPITGTPRAFNSVAVVATVPTTRSVVINEVAWGGTRFSSSHEWTDDR